MDTITLASLAGLLRARGLLERTANLTPAAGATPVSGCDCDSRVVRAGHVFVCKGAAFRAAYLKQAVGAGAVAYLCDAAHAPELAAAAPGVPALVASDLRLAMAVASAEAFGHPDRDLAVVGITGTKGKSTVSYMLRAVLDDVASARAGGPVPATAPATGVIGSIDTFDGVESFESHNTTPEAPDLWRHLAHMRDAGLAYVDMEVSSQGLKYDRVRGLGLDVACFLNIGRDHISPVEHPDFDDYFESKLRIFDQARTAVVNLDSDHADVILARAARCERLVTFSASGAGGPGGGTGAENKGAVGADGVSKAAGGPGNKPAAPGRRADVWASDVRTAFGSVRFRAHTPRWEGEVALGMPGLFNVDNALATIAIACALGLDAPELAPVVARALARARVPGRMELLPTRSGKVTALVDYAHNKLSYQRLFPSLREEFPGYDIIALFGAPGGKAQERRRELPEEAARWSDLLIYTEEDPANEPVEQICAQMAAATPAGTPYEVICDREEAVRRAVEVAYAGERPALVALLAKGDETRQHEGNDFVPCRPDGVIFAEAVAAHGDEVVPVP